MPLRRVRVATLIAAISLAGAVTASRADNVAIDTNGNGAPDFVEVSDWDGDGVRELEDIRAAILALTDPGDKLVRVRAGRYLPPPSAAGRLSIVDLPSHTTLAGSGQGVTILEGFSGTNPLHVQAVVGNAQPDTGNSDIRIHDLEVDGAWHGGDASTFFHQRMGVFLSQCVDCVVERVTIRDTIHTCLYTKNSTRVRFEDNALYRCGTFTGAGPTFPCIYLYADEGHTLQDVMVRDNSCDGSGTSALNTRRANAASTLRDVTFTGNIVRNTRVTNGVPANCISISGTDGGTFTDNVCVEAGPFSIGGSSAYYSQGSIDASTNILVDGLEMLSLPPTTHGLLILRYTENATFRNIHVHGTAPDADCLIYGNPLRNVVFERLALLFCGRMALNDLFPGGSGSGPGEGVTFRDSVVYEADWGGANWPAVRFQGPARGLTIDGLTIQGAAHDGIWWQQGMSDSTIHDVVVRDVGGHGFVLGGSAVRSALEGVRVEGAGGTGVLLAGGGGAVYDDFGIRQAVLRDVGSDGIAIGAPAVASGARFEDSVIDGIGGTAIRLPLSASVSSHGVIVARNTLRDFGRLASGPQSGRGVDIAGLATDVHILDNALDDVGNQAQLGIAVDLAAGPPAAAELCSNTFGGTFTTNRLFRVTGRPDYGDDDDLDGRVTPCDACASEIPPVDGDQDGVEDVCDLCPADSDRAQADTDGDGEGDRCDLDDGMIYEWLPDRERLAWQAESGFDSWNVYQGSLRSLRTGGEYTQVPGANPVAERDCGVGSLSLFLGDDPSANRTVFYIVTGVADGVEGSLGTDSAGSERPNSNPCP